MAFFEVKNLNVFFGENQVVFDSNFHVEEGQLCTMLGANGAGKTSTLNAVVGMIKKRGQVIFKDQDISDLQPHEIARLGISYVPEMRGTFQELSVMENLDLGCYLRHDKPGIKTDLERVYNYFPMLKKRLKQQAGTLSGGEQQMLAIARSLMMRPQLLLMDEPSLGLAPLLVQEIFNSLRMICDQEKISVLLIEQNASLALKLADYVYLLETGKVVLSGEPEMFLKDTSIQKAYLGIT
jgi:branched-chain amino acid transport system ATP-binding protein